MVSRTVTGIALLNPGLRFLLTAALVFALLALILGLRLYQHDLSIAGGPTAEV
jgi:hypothetical protein